ncbi:hypothetical protein L0657_05180 [Dyadobacter sp. CY345]|uniref:hypothetical protein n=1 Tax=Dyadobacter sp. CY345 TaxID=2909335 RepID=UPI001F3D46DC|nr:hypothetical protein [Dyadobacter sp. CY345]MCF2443340.1 hypothetical protein [Dyadobacter sp. CY345]
MKLLKDWLVVKIEEYRPKDTNESISLLDSMPIITCSGKRKGAVARDIADKGYCSTKGIYYYGVKLHCLSFGMGGVKILPYPESIVFIKASENDLTVFNENWASVPNIVFYGDKIYVDKPFFENLTLRKVAKC